MTSQDATPIDAAPTPMAAAVDAQTGAPRARRREPIFNAPIFVAGVALALVGLHGWLSLLAPDQREQLLEEFALAPRRFWAPMGTELAYPDQWRRFLTLISTALLHGGWLHVLVNSAMLLAFGTPVFKALGGGLRGMQRWIVVFMAAVIAGSFAYVAIAGPEGAPAVGASGGVSGLMAAAFLLRPDGTRSLVFAPQFLQMSLAFAVANFLLALTGPALAGGGIAWQAHMGGYVGGAWAVSLLAPPWLARVRL